MNGKMEENNFEKFAVPKVAIIILNWNGWKDTIECLESVFRNIYPNYQVIVIDNGSTNGSMEKIKSWTDGKQEVLTPEPTHPLYYLSHPPAKKPISYIYYDREKAERGGNFKLEEKVTKEWQEQRKSNSKELLNPTSSYPLIFIQTGENLGFAGGNNIGIRYMLKKDDFEYVWLLNNDTVIDNNALVKMVKLARGEKKIGMVGSKLMFYNNIKMIQSIGGGEIILLQGRTKIIGYQQKDKRQWNKPLEIDFITGASLLVKKQVIDEVGLMDENYFLYFEDADWSIRSKIKNYKLLYCPKSKIWHREGGQVKALSSFDVYYSTRNCLIFMKKYYKNYFLLNFLFLFIGRVIDKIGKKQFVNLCYIIKAYVDFLRGKLGKI